ncbi:hypothetical protein GCM10007962_18160 [Yeosuana aromativorans]|uniref:Uncharacterized protein n=2 Tax=Yeosuana aromativorans TaxID=288019 RepID=A0A8J3BIB1_9FLAO|nr:hypothetical protein GCM10007962_18160 [Yeosuana aromativorans]
MVTTNFLCARLYVYIYLNHQNNPNQMKTNFYIFLFFLLSFSYANAQEKSTSLKVVSVNELHVNNTVSLTIQDSIEFNANENTDSNNKIIARAASDIRILLNRDRNLENINLLFPKIYKEIVA